MVEIERRGGDDLPDHLATAVDAVRAGHHHLLSAGGVVGQGLEAVLLERGHRPPTGSTAAHPMFDFDFPRRRRAVLNARPQPRLPGSGADLGAVRAAARGSWQTSACSRTGYVGAFLAQLEPEPEYLLLGDVPFRTAGPPGRVTRVDRAWDL